MFVLIFGLCLFMKTQSAEAHTFTPAYSGVEKSASTGSASFIDATALTSQKSDDGCKDGCCSSTMSCCVATLPSSGMIGVYHETSGIVPFSHAPLPQGPPSTLLRPPKSAA